MGLRYPADPPKVEEIIAVMRTAGDGTHGRRLRGIIVIMWRARSIELPEGCSCELSSDLCAFLRDPTQTRFEWPLAKDRRAHVHDRIDTGELPVDHQTRRVGRPNTLVLTKTDALFKRETQRRRRNEEDLAWLKRNRGDRAAGRRTRSR